MKKNKLSFLTPTAFFTAILTLIIIYVVYTISGNSMFSPGELSKATDGEIKNNVSSHFELSESCQSCHTIPIIQPGINSQCIECHIEIKTTLNEITNLHGAIYSNNNRTINCLDCHTEHLGTNGIITNRNLEDFPHRLIEYSLSQHEKNYQGSEFSCENCHGENSYLNFSEETCLECHAVDQFDFMITHTERYGFGCLSCHNGYDDYAENFIHEETGFLLEGAHSDVKCDDCHKTQVLLELYHDENTQCASCHIDDDTHSKQYGLNCSTCHSIDSWEIIEFVHNFPLANNFYEECINCHIQDDEHNGEYGQSCQSCHVVSSWDEVTFDHNLLEIVSDCADCHQDIDEHNGIYGYICENCHTIEAWNIATFSHDSPGVSNQCSNCHISQDIHGGLFGNYCQNCHNTETWANAYFDHSLVNSSNCLNCHQFNDSHNGTYGTRCGDCHNFSNWKDATFNHTFPIKHEGSNGKCSNCHQTTPQGGIGSWTCYNCHEHSPSKIKEEHDEEGISNFGNCIKCHWDGKEHDD